MIFFFFFCFKMIPLSEVLEASTRGFVKDDVLQVLTGIVINISWGFLREALGKSVWLHCMGTLLMDVS